MVSIENQHTKALFDLMAKAQRKQEELESGGMIHRSQYNNGFSKKVDTKELQRQLLELNQICQKLVAS
jgi:hypothetical protein